MKSIYKLLLTGFLSVLLFSCYKDDTNNGTNPISEIKVAFTNIEDQVNLDKNEVLTIDPVITQNNGDKDLSYEWQIDYKTFSTEKKLVYPCSKLGKYFIRLKVTNADGSAFKSFNLNVNSPYEEGVMVLGEDAQGEGTLAFMRKYSTADIAAGKQEQFVNNLFTLNNPGEKIGKGPSDVMKRLKQVMISSSKEQKIYYLNDKTFEIEAVITAPDLPDFKPVAMNVPDAAFRTVPILCENGKVFQLALLENLVMATTRYPQNVINKTTFGNDFNDNFNYFWDPSKSQIVQVSGYYSTSSLTHFASEELVSFFFSSPSFYVITRDKLTQSIYTKTVFSNYIQNVSTKALNIKENAVLSVSGTPALNPQSPTLVNNSLKKLFYAQGSSVYSWFFTGTSMNTTPFITVDKGIVTSIEQNPTGSEIYVGVYDAAATGLKGSVYVYNADNGSLIKKYQGVCDKPVKVFYKKKS
ncbi:MAG: hypothetical protein E6Q95_01060 [Chitinophagaceae bacterium]|nr:MAG: hypothetical protein E6Q95_01060 [Chitinophagaceae bacterium]